MTQQEKLMDALGQCAKLLHRCFHMERAHGAPPHHGQGRLLHILYQQDGAALKELVELLDIRPSSAGELVDKLAQAGYVERVQDEGDKRVIRVYLTPSGRLHTQTLASNKQDVMRDTFSVLLEEEQAQLLDLLEKLNAGLKQRDGMQAHGACGRHGHGGHACGGPGHRGGPHGQGCHGAGHGRHGHAGEDR